MVLWSRNVGISKNSNLEKSWKCYVFLNWSTTSLPDKQQTGQLNSGQSSISKSSKKAEFKNGSSSGVSGSGSGSIHSVQPKSSNGILPYSNKQSNGQQLIGLTNSQINGLTNSQINGLINGQINGQIPNQIPNHQNPYFPNAQFSGQLPNQYQNQISSQISRHISGGQTTTLSSLPNTSVQNSSFPNSRSSTSGSSYKQANGSSHQPGGGVSSSTHQTQLPHPNSLTIQTLAQHKKSHMSIDRVVGRKNR